MLRTWKCWAAAAALSLLTAASALAADVSGKWTWTLMFQNNEIMQTLELKQEGEKLTGTLSRPGSDQKVEIKEGKVTGNDVSFVVIRERNGQEFKQTYKGKLEGTDTIKGNIVFTRNGEERMREWTAKKAK